MGYLALEKPALKSFIKPLAAPLYIETNPNIIEIIETLTNKAFKVLSKNIRTSKL
jgi:hypothetical protein